MDSQDGTTPDEANGTPGYLLFGGTGGIGTALAARLQARGARIHLVARTETELRAREASHGHTWTAADATSFEGAETAVREAMEALGRIDGIANCVGSILLKPAHATTEAQYDAVVRTNLTSAFAVVRAGARAMSAGGSIVLLSSAAARVGLLNHEAIAAAKAGVEGLARAAAATYARQGIRVNAVAPGLVDTPLSAPILSSELARQASVDMHPLGRIGTAEDVAAAIDWLLGPDAGWVTGQVVGVDGGLASVRGRKAR
jgi:NAD(P)-dependent dehydrogenase (short-subunit alcohol dehydrogenase family)